MGLGRRSTSGTPETRKGSVARFCGTLLNVRSDKLDPHVAIGIPRQPTAYALGAEPTVE